MSGPKVVRIVTREELQVAGLEQLRAIDAAIARCERTARRNDAWTAERAAVLADRRQQLENLFRRDRWPELARAASAEIIYLADEQTRITSAAIEKAERALRSRTRLGDAARTIASTLEAEGRAVPKGLLTLPDRAQKSLDQELPKLETELNAAIQLLGSTADPSESTEEQRSLASRLAHGERSQNYSEWVASRTTSQHEPDARIVRLLAELSVLAADEAISFTARLAVVAQERDANHRALLTDSLVLDLGAHVATAKAWSARQAELEDVFAFLEEFSGDEAVALRTRLESAVAARQMEAVTTIVAEARTYADGVRRKGAAAARRHAVLQGLAALGYEVREHMETAWAQQGRIVVKKPGVADYGVELGAASDAERIQLRLVGSATPLEPRGAARDKDAEVLWCSQVGQLNAVLAAKGSEFLIERAVPAGAQAVKTIAFDDASETETQRTDAPMRHKRAL